jgi:serine/threonine protein kinase
MSNIINVEEIFHAALEIASVEERNDFLNQACAETPSLRAQVDRLLVSHDKTSNFMEQSPTISFEEPNETADADATQAPNPAGRPDFRIDEQLPRCFGDYELLEKIAHGGMGIVFKARQASLNRVVAIKMILSGQFAGQDEITRFYVEAEAAGNLDHAGIVPVFDVGCDQGQHYLSMAYVEGQSLSQRIKEGPLPAREAATLTKKIALAIQVAHDQGIVHRDLKPGNVLLDERGEPRITDFGLAKRVEGDSNLTTTGMVLGTPSYMPPEQAAGKEIDAAADVYSLGAILYAMLTGRPPFEGDSQLETIFRVLQEEPIAPRKVDKSIPKDLEAICLKCLEKKTADRYKTAADLFADLQRFLASEPIQAKNDIMRRLRKWWLREPVLTVHLLVTLVLLAILLLNYWFWRNNPPGPEYHFQTLLGNVGILMGLAFVVLVFQKTQNIFQTKSVIPFAWAVTNPIFLTIALCWNGEPRSAEALQISKDLRGEQLAWLLPVYILLIVTSCFFRRVELVAISTVVSLIGYAVLALRYFQYSLHESPSYMVIFGVNMAVTGALLGLLTLRMKRLGEQNTS